MMKAFILNRMVPSSMYIIQSKVSHQYFPNYLANQMQLQMQLKNLKFIISFGSCLMCIIIVIAVVKWLFSPGVKEIYADKC